MNPWESLITPAKALLRRHAQLQKSRPAAREPFKQVKHKAGDVVGEWTLLEFLPGQRSPRVQAKWCCRCSCGVERDVQTSNLLTGGSSSCGHAMKQQLSDRAKSRPRRADGVWSTQEAANA